MLPRLVRARPFRGVGADVFNQCSYLALTSLCAALIICSGSALGRHVGLFKTDPLALLEAPAPVHTAYVAVRRVPAPPSPDPVLLPEPVPSVSPETAASPPLPRPGDLARPIHNGTWLPIVMYHYVRTVSKSDRLGWNLSVSPTDFRAQVRWLADNGYTAITMRDADLILTGARPMPVKPVVLTFDDGYRDFYTSAAPILREAGLTATNYIPTQLVDGKDYMTWAEIEELDGQGFEMAAHTQFHVDLSKTTAARAKIEVFGSKADLQEHLGHDVVDFAYPYGGVNLAVATLLRQAGFWSAVTTQPGSWHDGGHMLYLTRVRMGGTEQLQALKNGVAPPLPNELSGAAATATPRTRLSPGQ